ncbi:MAG: hypothetical protein EP330_17590 [Deltaproteobacteria bacterium]|nr:MAG: hypothetical protein EP330_17590 [Deltaproteobacteria bacterium]
MRRALLLLTAVSTLGFSLGCVAFNDPVGPLALDYEIDRVIVAAINVNPTVAVQGETVTIDALVLAPDDVDAVAVDVCGLDEQVPSSLFGVSCYDNDELITPIAPSIPARWDIPVVGLDCESEDTGGLDTAWMTPPCTSRVPLRVRAWSEGELGMGALDLELVRRGPDERRPRLALAERELTFEGNARRGQDIGLVYRIDWDGELDFRWYVDAGELHHTGRTATTWLNGIRHTTRNQLAIPSGYVGPLRVVVVANAGPGNMTWDVLTLEVE